MFGVYYRGIKGIIMAGIAREREMDLTPRSSGMDSTQVGDFRGETLSKPAVRQEGEGVMLPEILFILHVSQVPYTIMMQNVWR